ncbi:hypothetical protein D3C75_1084640 [compost metagenome]
MAVFILTAAIVVAVPVLFIPTVIIAVIVTAVGWLIGVVYRLRNRPHNRVVKQAIERVGVGDCGQRQGAEQQYCGVSIHKAIS